MSGKYNRSKRSGSQQPRMKPVGDSWQNREEARERCIREQHRGKYFKCKCKERSCDIYK